MQTRIRTVGIVGSGDIGTVIARLALASGFETHLSNSRGPETLTELAADLGPKAQASTVRDAIDASDLVVVSIPFAKYSTLPAERFGNRIVIDATNYIPHRDTDADLAGKLAAYSSPSQLLQEYLSASRVVKAFNNIYSGHLLSLARPSGAPDRSALPIAGNHEEAKAEVTRFLDQLGWDAVDAGALAESTRFDVGRPAFVRPYLRDTSGTDMEWGTRMTSDPGKPLNKATVKALLNGR